MTGRSDPLPERDDLRALAEREAPVVSLLAPVAGAVPDPERNAVRQGRLVDAAAARMRELGLSQKIVDEACEALDPFANDRAGPRPAVKARAAFWSPDAGLTRLGLPADHGERLAVATTALLRPVASATQRPGRYRLLALSANAVALFTGDAEGLTRVEDAGLPSSLEDALGGDLSEQALQLHATSRGRGDAVFHGQGGADRGREVDLERFHRMVARALEAQISDDGVPLVLAGDVTHRPGLEAALRHEIGLLPKGVEGNPDHLSPAALHEAAWPIVRDAAVDARDALVRAREEGGEFVSRVDEVVSHAVMGRVRRLWVPGSGRIPGRVDPASATATSAWGDDDLIEALTAYVVRRGGDVLVLDEDPSADPTGVLMAELR